MSKLSFTVTGTPYSRAARLGASEGAGTVARFVGEVPVYERR